MEAAWVFLATFAFKVLGIFTYVVFASSARNRDCQKSKFPEWAGQALGLGTQQYSCGNKPT